MKKMSTAVKKKDDCQVKYWEVEKIKIPTDFKIPPYMKPFLSMDPEKEYVLVFGRRGGMRFVERLVESKGVK